jgi:hypothetical protein
MSDYPKRVGKKNETYIPLFPSDVVEIETTSGLDLLVSEELSGVAFAYVHR